ncbi:M20/M25/M40 family metallo-hydrolase [Dysgonomonas reticulitermitis]
MKNKILLALLFILPSFVFSQSAEEKGLSSIVRHDAERFITILASDSLEGRKGGEPGGLKAAEYIRAELKSMGVKPWKKDYFQPFTSTSFRATSNEMRNVLGYIRGKNANEVVMVGAHYDHIGIRKTPIDNDSIFNGADDNASGVAAVLQVAKAFMASGRQPERTIIFGFWDGEEMGLLGSYHFVDDYYKNIPIPLTAAPEIKAYINCDMVGRNKDDNTKHVIAYYSPEKEIFQTWINDDIEGYNLNLEPEFRSMDNQNGGSDHMPFMSAGAPIIFYHTDLHKDYHKLTDHSDKINFDKVTEIAKVTFLNMWHMANEEDY